MLAPTLSDLPRRLDPFLGLGHERNRDPAPAIGRGDRFARIVGRDVPGNGVLRAAGRLGRTANRSGQIVGSMGCPCFLRHTSFRGLVPGDLMWLDTMIKPQKGAPTA